MPSISVSMVNSARPVTMSVAAGAPTLAPTALPGSASSIAATPLTASSMARYPVQRHRFPFSARGRSCFCSSVNVAEVMIMPAVQKPHWKPGRVTELPLQRMQVLRRAEALDRRHLAAVGAEGRGDATVHGIAVEPHRARTAIACVTTLLDAVLAQRTHERAQALAGMRLVLERLTVHRVRHGRSSVLSSTRISSA